MKKLFTSKTLGKIDIIGSPKVRGCLNLEAIEEYRQTYISKRKMPEVVLFETESDHYLIGDGLHRVTAISTLPTNKFSHTFDVRKGTFDDCLAYALKANLAHGMRRTNADKRQGVISALKAHPDKSNVWISELAAVGDTFVGSIRKELEAASDLPQIEKREGRDGRKTKVDLVPREVKNKGNVENKGKSEDSNRVPAVSSRISEPVSPAPELDETGYKIPADLRGLWIRSEEVRQLMKSISEVKCQIEKAKRDGDPLYAEIRNSLIADLTMCREAVSYALPYAVCPMCSGRNSERCAMCKGRGLVSKELYLKAPVSMRSLRERLIKGRPGK